VKIIKRTALILSSVLILLADPSVINAQRSHFSFSLSPVLPLTDLKTNARWGFLGGNINYRFDLIKKLSWCCSIAYQRFGSRTVIVDSFTGATYESKLAYIPVTSGFQFFLNNNKTRYYLVAKGGYYFPSADFEEGDWGVSPGAGVQIPFQSKNMKIDFSLMYDRIFGSVTKEFTAYSKYGGSVTSQTSYSYTSYIAVNIGLSFGK
jgi:hypothetical protein